MLGVSSKVLILLLPLLSLSVDACNFHSSTENVKRVDPQPIVDSNNRRRSEYQGRAPEKVALTNVRVFDGYKILPPATVVIDEDGKIGTDATGATQIDGNNGVLLPGLMDTHSHPKSVDHLESFSSFGVTTAMSMSCFPISICTSLKNHTGLTDLLYAGASATAPNSTHANLAGYPQNWTLTSPDQAPHWVSVEAEAGSSFIKIFAENFMSASDLDQSIMDALVTAAHSQGLHTAFHASTLIGYGKALASGTDQIAHTPLDSPLNDSLVAQYVAQHTVSTPTLTMMRSVTVQNPQFGNYSTANSSVASLYAAHVPILVGTDSQVPVVGTAPLFGSSIHDEFENLVQAGLSNLDALRGATTLAAEVFGLKDRGVIAPGKRADLVLISGDPLVNISNTRNIQRVWIGGLEFTGSKNASST